MPLVIRHNTALAFEIDTWKLSGHIQTQVYETLTKLSLRPSDWGRVVGAMFIAATYVSVRDVIARAGQFAMTGAFRWLEHDIAKQALPSHAWREALAPSALSLLSQSKELQPAELALCAWCVSSEDVRRILSANREDVQRMAEAPSDAIPAPLQLSTAFLLLALGLRESGNAGVNLVLRNFFAVHDALASGRHSSESWWLLLPELPSLSWWRDWDRCEKLRRAVHSALAQCGALSRIRKFARTPEERELVRKVVGEQSDDSSPGFID